MKNVRQTSVILLVNRAVGQKSSNRRRAEAERSRRVFSGPEISRLRNLFQWMESGDEAVRRNARREMELLGFYPTEFCADYRNMTEVEFDDLIGLGVIYVADWDQGQSLGSPNEESEAARPYPSIPEGKEQRPEGRLRLAPAPSIPQPECR
jgi:hypothetical protein